MEVREYEPLAPYTTFNIGGAARYFVYAQSLGDVQQSFALAQQLQLPLITLSGGSNVLIADKGVQAVVVRIALTDTTIDTATGIVSAGAGASLQETIMHAAEEGLGGWESMYGIPGTIGGAVRGNAGAFGTEIKDILHTATAWNKETNEVKTFTHEECTFGYRTSFFKQHPVWVVLGATLQLQPTNAESAIQACENTFAERTKRQIQHIQSAGSFFMNPVAPAEVQALFKKEKGVEARGGRVPAGWLIDKCGLKGLKSGPVQTGERSANYLINMGGATAADVLTLAATIKEAVEQKFGITLQEEITMLGF